MHSGPAKHSYINAQWSRETRQYPLRWDTSRALFGDLSDHETLVHFYSGNRDLYLCGKSVVVTNFSTRGGQRDRITMTGDILHECARSRLICSFVCTPRPFDPARANELISQLPRAHITLYSRAQYCSVLAFRSGHAVQWQISVQEEETRDIAY